MKTLLRLALPLALALLTGCVSTFRLPEITAVNVEYTRSDPLGGTTVTAKNVAVNDKTVTADEAVWDTKYPAVTIRLKVTGYERKREAAAP